MLKHFKSVRFLHTLFYNVVIQNTASDQEEMFMNVISTKKLLLQYLERDVEFSIESPYRCTTSDISETMHISRSLTSQYLNELNKEGKLVKVTSRPVYYFSTKRLEELYSATVGEFEFYDMEELHGYLQKGKNSVQDFQKVIGNEGTLSYCTMQMKSAMLYPPDGLPIIFHGRKGSGKAYLAEVMYEYGVNQRILSSHAHFVKDHIASIHEPYEEVLFGTSHADRIVPGLLEKAAGGLLYLGDAGNMNMECQRRLTAYITKGTFTRIYDDKTILNVKTRIVLGVEHDLHEQLYDELLLNIPVVCEIPALSMRPQGERNDMIVSFLIKEAQSLKKEILLSKSLYQVFMGYHFHDSIDDMNTNLRLACANAYAQSGNEEEIHMYLRHLPMEVFGDLELSLRGRDSEELLGVDELKMQDGKRQILQLYEQILEAHQMYLERIFDEPEWVNSGLNAMRCYYDFIVFEQRDDDLGRKTIAAKLEELISEVEKQFQITLPLNCSFILARMVYAIYRMQSEVQLWEHQHKDAIHSCQETLDKQLPDVSAMAASIIRKINGAMDVKLGTMNTIFLIFNIHFYNRDVINRDTCGVIISHGYSTATSIADAVNQMLEMQVFKAIDMPLDTDVKQIQKKLVRFVELHPNYRNLIIMVDMGSLEEIASGLQADMNIGVINNISTGLALDIGNRIQRHQELEDILQNACRGFECHYQILSKSGKEKAIVFTNDVGMKVSSKLVELFKSSLPKVINLKFIEYDYDRLQKMGIQDVLFDKYEVILLIKPHMLKLDGIQSLSLEELISFKSIAQVNQILSQYLNDAEIESFNKQLLKNFSLQSIMENLTILNPGKLLDQVSEAITQLQLLMDRKFQSKTIIGIYMHTCFLIERLVTKTAILSDDMDAFEKAHPDFIRNVHISFEKMLKNYSVEIPISEISYLYDYIQNEEWEEK